MQRLTREIAGAAIALMLFVFATVQVASDAFTAGAAAPGSFPTRIPIGVGLRVYRILARVTPATYVEATLAHYGLQIGDIGAAQSNALALPPGPTRNELLGRIALARGDRVLALEYFFAAPDITALQREVVRVAQSNPVAAYAYERRVRKWLVTLRTHPDAVAEAYWRMGGLAAAAASRLPPRSARRAAWLRRGLKDEIAAARLAPLSEKYLLSAGSTAFELREFDVARHWYRRALGVDPGSAAALAGLRAVARPRAR